MVDSTISGILENEKYYGDALLQKTITIDFLRHKRVDNKGQAEQYIIEGNHPPIISKEIFDRVQAEKARRAAKYNNIEGDRQKYSNKYPSAARSSVGTAIIYTEEGSGTAITHPGNSYGSVKPI